ncbi:hypothetical protein RRG08_022391 [Elysia crispata]|uniref:Uncharacterized protein n=1 Tax=Elysia crispata TaxID=231223 RepID=A0AAE0Z140_9GAST|nr:hypothetical protein RRG08_022391 [Elysia crispata]
MILSTASVWQVAREQLRDTASQAWTQPGSKHKTALDLHGFTGTGHYGQQAWTNCGHGGPVVVEDGEEGQLMRRSGITRKLSGS